MNEYVKQAKDFLESCNATMKITKIGCEQNNDWNDKGWHNTYRVTIKTPLGSMWVKFWDSVYNTRFGNEPNEYDILACLQKYDVGSMDDFMYEFGYEIKCTKDMTNFINTYNAVVKEYQDICRCFTDEQIEAMQEIQ